MAVTTTSSILDRYTFVNVVATLLCFRTSFGNVDKLDDGFFVALIAIVARMRNILMVAKGCKISANVQQDNASLGSYVLVTTTNAKDDESFEGMDSLLETEVVLQVHEAKEVIYADYHANVQGNMVKVLNEVEVDIPMVHSAIRVLVHEKVRSIKNGNIYIINFSKKKTCNFILLLQIKSLQIKPIGKVLKDNECLLNQYKGFCKRSSFNIFF